MKRSAALLAGPPVILATTAAAFRISQWGLGNHWGYLAGFVFYWTAWCGAFPLWILGVSGVLHALSPGRAALGWRWVFLILPPLLPAIFTLPGQWQLLSPNVVLLSTALGGINGVGEELLWRACYLTQFGDRSSWWS